MSTASIEIVTSGTQKIEVETSSRPGSQGFPGWSPVVATVADGQRIVLKIQDWTGGNGTKPAIGQYISNSGLTTVIANATNVRGASENSGDVIILTANVIPSFGSKYISGANNYQLDLSTLSINQAHGLQFQVLSTESNKIGLLLPANSIVHQASARSIGSKFEEISFTSTTMTAVGGMILEKGFYTVWCAFSNSILNIYIF